MQKDILDSLAHLTDDELTAGVKSLAARERDASARMIAHLAEMDIRDIHLRAPDVPMSVVPIPEFAVVPHPPAAGESDTAPPKPAASDLAPPVPAAVSSAPPTRPALPTPLSPKRYKLQLTISGETLEKLRRAKDMLGHSVAAGDDDAVLNRALTVLLDKLAREKCARTDKPRPGRPRNRRARRPSAAVRRILWERDGGRCKYTSTDGHRCEETRRIEEHHLDHWGLGNDADDPDAFELRCQRHNEYEGRLYFGKRRRRGDGEVRERATPYGTALFSAELVPEQVAASRGHAATTDW